VLGTSSIQSAEISTIAHATEDPAKVESALRGLLQGLNQQFTRNYLEGHHGNQIVKFSTRLTQRNAVEFARHFIEQLSKSERSSILQDLTLHCDDEGNLYVRINKQKLFRGEVQLGDDDPIRIKIKLIDSLAICMRQSSGSWGWNNCTKQLTYTLCLEWKMNNHV